MKEVGTDGEDTFDTRAHQGRGDDETAAGTDAAGDQAGADADQNGGTEDEVGVVRGSVGGFSADEGGQGLANGVGKGDAAEENGDE